MHCIHFTYKQRNDSCIVFVGSSSLLPAYLSRGPPVLQHPERVIPLSECERFEPHFQPNVALAPISTPTQMGQISPLSSVHQRRHHHEHRRHGHRSTSPTSEKQELLSSADVKLEKTSPNQAVEPYNIYYIPDESPKETVLPGKEKKEKEGVEEEESSAAVTSSTVTVEPLPLATSSEVGTSSPSESDSDSDGTAAADLEERLRVLNVPQDVIELARRVASENAQLRRHRQSDAHEISKLRSQLHMHKLQQQQQQQQSTIVVGVGECRDKKEDASAMVPRASAADSTEGCSEDIEATTDDLPSNNKESDPANVLVTNNNESDQ